MSDFRQCELEQLIEEWADQTRLSVDERKQIRSNVLHKQPNDNLEWLPYLYQNLNFLLRINQLTG